MSKSIFSLLAALISQFFLCCSKCHCRSKCSGFEIDIDGDEQIHTPHPSPVPPINAAYLHPPSPVIHRTQSPTMSLTNQFII